MNNISRWNNICKTCDTRVPLSNSSLLPLGSVIHTTGKQQKHGWYKTIKSPQIFISGAGIVLPREFFSKTAMKQHHDHLAFRPQVLLPICPGKRQFFASKSKKIQAMSLSWFWYKSFSNLQVFHCSLIFCVPIYIGALQGSQTLCREYNYCIWLFTSQTLCRATMQPKKGKSMWKIYVVNTSLTGEKSCLLCRLRVAQAEALTQPNSSLTVSFTLVCML